MYSTLLDTTQPAGTTVSRQQAEQPPVNGAAKAATQPLGLPEDIVTLSSSEGSDPRKITSQPVSSEEKRALLRPDSPRSSFSVYG